MPQPLFFNEIKFIPAIEVALHRGLWSFIFLLIILVSFGKFKEFIDIFYSYKKVFILSVTAGLISINWAGFIFAVSINKVQDASMGYFITPMISIILGYFFLKEKISILKLISLNVFSKLNTPLKKTIDNRKKGKDKDLCNFVSISFVEYPLSFKSFISLVIFQKETVSKFE